MNFYLFGLICLSIVNIIAIILAIKDKENVNQNISKTSSEKLEVELSELLNNLEIYNPVDTYFNER